MADDLHALEDWAGALLAQLEPAQRRKLTQAVARDLRRSQQRRIATQHNPDGSAYAPRKPRQAREKTGRIKHKMFSKLGSAKYLKLQSTADSVAISFLGRTARMARIHQYGLRDKPGRNSPDIQYERRELLGFTAADRELIRDSLLAHLAL
jgi:phage virion morphogenesis protein